MPPLCLVLCLAFAGPPEAEPAGQSWTEDPIVQPDGDEKARALFWFRRAEFLRARARFVEAVDAYGRSYKARRSQEALFNAAATAELVSNLDGLAGYQTYLKAFPEGRRRDYAQTRARELEGELAQLRIRVQQDAKLMAVRVDGTERLREDFPRYIEPGLVEIQIIREVGPTPEPELVELAAAQVYVVVVEPAPKLAQRQPRETGPVDITPPPDRTALRRVFWTGVGLTGAAAASIPLFGSLALFHSNEYRRENCAGSECSPGPNGEPPQKEPPDGFPFDHLRGIETFRPLTNTMIGVSLGLAVATSIVGVLAWRREARSEGTTDRPRFEAGVGAVRLRF